jgi:hypothetical protein
MSDPFPYIPEELKHFLDGLSLVATLGVLVSWLPAFSAALSCIWLGIRIYESKTVQGLLGKSPPTTGD